MGFLGGLHEVDGLSVQTAMPPLGVGLKQASLLDVGNFFQSHLPHVRTADDTAVTSLVRTLQPATAFLQASGRPRKLFGLAAAGVSELLTGPRTRRGGGGACKAICLVPGAGCSSHEDFLFGGQLSDDAMTPKQSMMVGWFAGARATFKGDEHDERVEDEGKGWSKVIPRSLGFFTVVDMASAMVVFCTRNYVCDAPLRTWLLGGILLGGPTDLLIKGLAWILKPRYKYYKLQVVNCRDAPDTEFQMEQLELWDEFGREIQTYGNPDVDAVKEGSCWMVTLNRFPRMISSYRIKTALSQDASKDPVSWQLWASNNNRTWRMIDEQDNGDVPQARGAPSRLITELTSLTEDASFRQAFLAELIATGVALGWLTIGSAWIAGSSESCVDSAPELWYYCFLLAVLTWSCLVTVTIGLIVSAVAMIVLGVKTP